ncbi:MAG: homoserine kinase [Eubacteriales bacterium]
MRKITLRVPATSANVGPGFDSLGIAFSLYNTFTFEEKESGIIFSGFEKEFANEKNLAFVAYKKVAETAKKNIGGLHIGISSDVPVARGLGSSATLIAAGAVAANELLSCGYSKKELIEICFPLEGHADNLTPAFIGGFTAAMTDGGKLYTESFDISDNLKFFALVPDFETKTVNARAVLPREVPRGDAVANVSHVAMLIKAMRNGDIALLRAAINDKLHEPYRRKLIYNFDTVKSAAKDAGAPVFFISGSGSTCMCVSEEDIRENLESALSKVPHNWKVYPVSVDKTGADIIYE